MKVTILSSGSSGNATLIEVNNLLFLLDCGISYKNLSEKMEISGYNINDLTHVFISHEHIDHIKGLKQLVKKQDIEIIMSNGTFEYVKPSYEIPNLKLVSHLEQIKINDVLVGCLGLSHDSNEPMLYVFKFKKSKFWFFHDSGYMPQKYFNILANPTLMVIESNYDFAMLQSSKKYPHHIKMRIHSDYGHLSNDQAYNYVNQLVGKNTKEVIIAHVSENNNDVIKINELYKDFKEIKVSISEQKNIMETRVLNNE